MYSASRYNSYDAYWIILHILLTILLTLLNQWSFHHISNEAEITGNGSNRG